MGGTVSQPQKSNHSKRVSLGGSAVDTPWLQGKTAAANCSSMGIVESMNSIMPVGQSVSAMYRSFALGERKGSLRQASVNPVVSKHASKESHGTKRRKKRRSEKDERDHDVAADGRVHAASSGAAGHAVTVDAADGDGSAFAGVLTPEMLQRLAEGGEDVDQLMANVAAADDSDASPADSDWSSDVGQESDEEEGSDVHKGPPDSTTKFIEQVKKASKHAEDKGVVRAIREYFNVAEDHVAMMLGLFDKYGLDYLKMRDDSETNYELWDTRRLRFSMRKVLCIYGTMDHAAVYNGLERAVWTRERDIHTEWCNDYQARTGTSIRNAYACKGTLLAMRPKLTDIEKAQLKKQRKAEKHAASQQPTAPSKKKSHKDAGAKDKVGHRAPKPAPKPPVAAHTLGDTLRSLAGLA